MEQNARHRPMRSCLRCGYILDWVSQPNCPECGRAFDPENPATYAPAGVPQLCRAPWWVVALFAMVALGVPSIVLRGSRRVIHCVMFWVTPPLALGFFGPFWGEVMFKGYSMEMREAGLWPFLAVCMLTPVASVALAMWDRQVRRRE